MLKSKEYRDIFFSERSSKHPTCLWQSQALINIVNDILVMVWDMHSTDPFNTFSRQANWSKKITPFRGSSPQAFFIFFSNTLDISWPSQSECTNLTPWVTTAPLRCTLHVNVGPLWLRSSHLSILALSSATLKCYEMWNRWILAETCNIKNKHHVRGNLAVLRPRSTKWW